MARKKTAKIAEKLDSSSLITAFEEKGPADVDAFLLDGAIDRIKEWVLGC